MNRKLISDILLLINGGWRPYSLKPEKSVYERIGCALVGVKRKEPVWFVREDIFLCISCSKGCTLNRPEGFVLPLPMPAPKTERKEAFPFQLTPGEMVRHKALLRVDEAAYCLNISERQVYDWIAEGKLRSVKDKPIRVSAEDVALCMSNFAD